MAPPQPGLTLRRRRHHQTSKFPDIELVPEAPEFEQPEAPESRLIRLRRRLAGSNSPLSRGLLLLITRDRIDEDTWEEFEETLITSDLGWRRLQSWWTRCGASCVEGSQSRESAGHPAGRAHQARRSTMDRTSMRTELTSPPWSWWSASTAQARPRL
jgi:hypothetical protein